MLLTVVLPAVLIVVGLIAFYLWYRRKIAAMTPTEIRPPSGARLTAERLRSLASPPWRVVFEVPERTLGDIDQVVVGPIGVVAVRTVLGDRPQPAERDDDPSRLARSALARADVTELVATVGGRCDQTLVVHWGASNSDEPAAFEIVPGEWAVDGHRLVDWLIARPPGSTTTAEVDLLWQAVTTGIGRPDPLA